MRLSRLSLGALGLILVLAVALVWPVAGRAGSAVTLKEAEDQLVRGGYAETLMNTHWAVEQGAAIVPLLEQMLQKRQAYDEELGGATGAFPFNVLWALGHIPQPTAIKVLEKYAAVSHDASAALAIKGWQLRAQKQSRGYGVLINDAPLLSQPAGNSQVLKQLKAGQAVQIVQAMITSPGEEGPRGGPAHYDQVKLLPGGEQGYIARSGDDFSPFM